MFFKKIKTWLLSKCKKAKSSRVDQAVDIFNTLTDDELDVLTELIDDEGENFCKEQEDISSNLKSFIALLNSLSDEEINEFLEKADTEDEEDDEEDDDEISTAEDSCSSEKLKLNSLLVDTKRHFHYSYNELEDGSIIICGQTLYDRCSETETKTAFYFDKENAALLKKAIKQQAGEDLSIELAFIKLFFVTSHVECWFDEKGFASFCQDNSITYKMRRLDAVFFKVIERKRKKAWGYTGDLLKGKTYIVVDIENDHYRIIDESGEDYLYLKDIFKIVK